MEKGYNNVFKLLLCLCNINVEETKCAFNFNLIDFQNPSVIFGTPGILSILVALCIDNKMVLSKN